MTTTITTEHQFRRHLQGVMEFAQIDGHVSVRHGGDALVARIECKTLADAETLERRILQQLGNYGVIVQFPGLTVSLPLPAVERTGDAQRGEALLSKTFGSTTRTEF